MQAGGWSGGESFPDWSGMRGCGKSWRRGRDSNRRRANNRNASLCVVYIVDE